MKNYFFLFVSALFFTGASAQDSPATDSVVTISSTEGTIAPLFSSGDTLTDFNTLNGGIVKFQLTQESESVIAANGLEIKNPGVVVVKDAGKMSDRFQFEIKTFANDREWYINTVNVQFEGQVPVIHVSSDKIEMATAWRKDGKIFVVIAVVAVLFGVVLLYLFLLDRKTNALKKQLNG